MRTWQEDWFLGYLKSQILLRKISGVWQNMVFAFIVLHVAISQHMRSFLVNYQHDRNLHVTNRFKFIRFACLNFAFVN